MFEDNSLKKGVSAPFLEFLKEKRFSRLFGLLNSKKPSHRQHVDRLMDVPEIGVNLG